MRVAVFSQKPYDREFLEAANADLGHELSFFEPRLSQDTVALAGGFPAVCVFVNDCVDELVLERLAEQGTRLIALRCAGYNNVNLEAAQRLGITVVRVPAYSPHAVAEHTAGLILTLNRKLHRAYNRVRDGNFSLDGLLGFDLHGRTVGVIGTGRIGVEVVRVMLGFGCRVLVQDPHRNPEVEAMDARYVGLPELFQDSDIITLHCPLSAETHYLIGKEAVEQMKHGVMLINTSRGALVDTPAVIDGLKSGRIGYLGLDVYEEEAPLFFEDRSEGLIQDDTFSRLLTFPNVVITGHQAFFTREAMQNIAATTLQNITAFESGEGTLHRVGAD